MTEAEALDMAAKAAGWGSWEYVKTHCDHCERHGIRTHAATIMENAALEAKLAVAREALEEIADVGDDVDCSDCKASGVSARAALKEIGHGDR